MLNAKFLGCALRLGDDEDTPVAVMELDSSRGRYRSFYSEDELQREIQRLEENDPKSQDLEVFRNALENLQTAVANNHPLGEPLRDVDDFVAPQTWEASIETPETGVSTAAITTDNTMKSGFS